MTKVDFEQETRHRPDAKGALDRLAERLGNLDETAIAVSGGVDSLTLARVAAIVLKHRVSMYHAISPAVPGAATRRARQLAERYRWRLDVFDAGEFADPNYRANPINRCFFCKTNLYRAIAKRTTAQILSGTNLDDLGDYRPGLEAAREHHVRHPFVEAQIDKATVRRISTMLGMGEIAELPAAPCLASRMETGIAIEPKALAFIDEVENWLRSTLQPQTVRCRLRAKTIVIEFDAATIDAMDGTSRSGLIDAVQAIALKFGMKKPVFLEAYRMGSAFLAGAA